MALLERSVTHHHVGFRTFTTIPKFRLDEALERVINEPHRLDRCELFVHTQNYSGSENLLSNGRGILLDNLYSETGDDWLNKSLIEFETEPRQDFKIRLAQRGFHYWLTVARS